MCSFFCYLFIYFFFCPPFLLSVWQFGRNNEDPPRVMLHEGVAYKESVKGALRQHFATFVFFFFFFFHPSSFIQRVERRQTCKLFLVIICIKFVAIIIIFFFFICSAKKNPPLQLHTHSPLLPELIRLIVFALSYNPTNAL